MRLNKHSIITGLFLAISLIVLLSLVVDESISRTGNSQRTALGPTTPSGEALPSCCDAADAAAYTASRPDPAAETQPAGGSCCASNASDASYTRPRINNEITSLSDKLNGKQQELWAALSQDKLDEAGTASIMEEINSLSNELNRQWLTTMIDFRKKNPDWRPE